MLQGRWHYFWSCCSLPRRGADDPETTDAQSDRTETHTVHVRTKLLGPRAYYIEGARVQIELEPAVDPDWTTTRRPAPMSVGDDITWADVPAGGYELTGAVFPCNGNCGELGLQTEGCALDLEVQTDVEIVVRFRWGTWCTTVAEPS